MPTENRMQAHWVEVKQFIQKEWPLLSKTVLDQVNGDYDKFLEHLKETYNQFPLEEAKARNKIKIFLDVLEKIGM